MYFYVHQWRANPNPDFDLNPDLMTFVKSSGFGFGGVDFDLYLKIGLDLDLDLNIDGFAHH